MPSKIIRIAYNPVVAKLYDADEAANVIVSTALSYFVTGYEFTDAYSRGWDGRSTFFKWLDGTFPRGFVDDVETALSSAGYTVQRVCKPLLECLGPNNPTVDSFGDAPRYDYQMKTVRELEKRGVMIAHIATGGGKSRIAKLAYARINRPTLFITTRKALMYQMKDSFDESGFECGVMGDGEWEPHAKLNVAMVQTLILRLASPDDKDKSAAAVRQRRIRDKTVAFLQNVEFIIGEEAHESSGNSYYDFMNHCKKAAYKLALTATPFMKDAEEANMRLKAAFGPIGITVTEKLLIDRGILATPRFKFYNNTYSGSQLRKSTNYQRAVELGIVNDVSRNAAIVSEVKRAASYGLTSMVLVMRKAHGEILEKKLTEAGLRVSYIYGDKNQKVRQSALQALEAGDLDVIIGTNILDVGIDIPAVGLVVIAGGGKAEVSHRQRVGRGMREKKKGPNLCLFLDFSDMTNSHLRKHAYSRYEIINQTPGFSENILPDDEDFDYEAMGFNKI